MEIDAMNRQKHAHKYKNKQKIRPNASLHEKKGQNVRKASKHTESIWKHAQGKNEQNNRIITGNKKKKKTLESLQFPVFLQ